MDRRVVIVALFIVLTVLALTLASLAFGSGGPAHRASWPSMSGEFAHRQLACMQHPAPWV